MAKKSGLVNFVHKYLDYELRIVSTNPVGLIAAVLSLEEQTLIYKYSEDGYESVNQSLRNSLGQTHTLFGKFLDVTLKKLPDYKGLVYRSATLGQKELDRYIQAFDKNTILVEHSFVSTSISYTIANMFGGNCRFEMISRSGKRIDLYTKYSLEGGQNEYEVLFRPNCKFAILEITKLGNHTLIIMEEV